ncbi:DUF4347 domain-containing protein [Vibrio sp. SM6]|uniref:DUF4347 domain-containing protein n=1 Tax=Vibrio agarilyticus TaxID=2726741 RepID=A0A7X8TNV5_9VIBR|nr:putative Ig domain-containing protein [Vibrio agarilyticus]NLS12186.1 DUF4347 domain-containing protein [Vibrio agarilyticus]
MDKFVLTSLATAIAPFGLYAASGQTMGSYQRSYLASPAISGLNVAGKPDAERLELNLAVEHHHDDVLAIQTGQSVNQLVIIDDSVPDKEQFLSQARPGTDFRFINAEQDGLEQLKRVLADYQNLAALHIVSHADDGVIYLGASQVTGTLLQAELNTLSAIDFSLKDGADVLLYGCDLAKSSKGEALLEVIANGADVNVAASDDLTGLAASGGDWDLEIASGEISTLPLFDSVAMRNFTHVLAYSGTLNLNNVPTGYANQISYQVSGTGYTLVFKSGGSGGRDLYSDSGYVYVGTGSSTNTSADVYFSGGETFTLTSLYVYHSSDPAKYIRVTSDKGGQVDSASKLGNVENTTLTFSGEKWENISKFTIQYSDNTTLKWLKIDDIAIENLQLAGDTTPPTITDVTIADSAHKVGDVVTATIMVDSDSDNYTSGSGSVSGTIAGYTVSALTKKNDTTYEVSFTITDGGTNIAAASTIPVNITLTDSSGNASAAYTTAISQANDAIYANLPDITLSADTNLIAEDGGVATLTATLSHQWPQDITVNLAYSGTATATTDYLKSDSITISAGSATGTTTVTGVADTLYDAASAETIVVDISSVSVGSEDGVQQETIAITDSESAPKITLSTSHSSIAEDGGASSVTASLSHSTYEDVTVSLGYSGTATSGSDYATPSSSIVISAGSTSADATTGISATNDATEEESESIIIDVSNVSGGGATEDGSQQKTVTIIDDDDETAPVFENSTPSPSSITASGVTLSVDLDEEGTVYYVVVDDGASAPSAAQVEAGQDAGGNTVSVKGSFSTTGTLASKTISGLEDGSDYDVYLVAKDAVGNPQASPTLVNLSTTDTQPNVRSITVSGSPAANASSIDFLVSFGDEVSHISSDDFTPKLGGNTSSGLAVTGVSASSGTSVTVTVSVTDVVGEVRLDLNGGTDIADETGNTPAAFTTGDSHTVDTIAPTVTSIVRKTPTTEVINADSLVWTVTFSESLNNIDGGDFSVSGTTASVSSVSASSGSSVDVTVSGGDLADYNGAVALSIAGANNVADGSGNGLSSTSPTGAAETYTLDNAAPSFVSVDDNGGDNNYKAGETITFEVDLGEAGLTVNANLSVLDSDFSSTATLTDDGDGTYSLTTTVLNLADNMQEGSIAVTFTATDSAGNSSTDNSLILTLDKTAPTFDSGNSTPNDNATGVSVADNVVLDFSEAVTLNSGQTMTLVDVTNNATFEVFTATSTTAATGNNGGTVSVSSDKVTLNPGADLLAGTEYAVQVSASFVQDLAGNLFAGISDNTTFNFTTAPTLVLSASAAEMSEKGGSITYTVSLQDGSGNPFTATENIVAIIQLGGTATKDIDYSVTGLGSIGEVTIASGTSSTTFTITATDDAVADDAETVSATLNSVSSGSASISSSHFASVTLNENNPPLFNHLDATPTYTEDGSAIVIDDDVTVSDTELDALNGGVGNYDGATLTIARSGGANANDVFANNGLLGALTEGGNLVYNGTTVGTVTTNSNGTLTLTFNSNATTALVNSVLQNITYANSANEPAGSVVLNFTFNDGTDNNSGTNQVTTNITASNDAPTLTATGENSAFTEGGSAVAVFSSADASTVESGQTLSGFVLTVTNLSDSSSEVLSVDGSDIALNNSVNGTTSTNGLNYAVVMPGTTATLTFTGGRLSETELQTLIDAIRYQNNSQDPTTDSSRVVTITSLTDSGNENATTSLSVFSTVSLTPVNDEPTLTATGGNPTFTEGGDAAVVFSGSSASTVETGQTLSGLVLTVTNVTDDEVLTVDGDSITLEDAVTGTTAASSLSYTVAVASDTATVTVTGGSLTTDAFQALVDGIRYQNNSEAPAIDNTRVVTITSLSDSGSASGANDNVNDTLNIASSVTVSAVNDAPVVTGLVSVFNAIEDVVTALDVSGITVSDAEGDSVSIVLAVSSGVLTVANGNGTVDGVTVSGSGTASVTLSGSVADINSWLDTTTHLSFTSGLNANGNVTFTVTPLDADTGSAVSSSVSVTAVNDAPVISGSPATTVAEDSAYSFIPTASDVDVGDSLTYTIINKPGWVSFNTATGALTGTPGNDAVGITSDIRISVTDGEQTATLAAFSLEVTNVNDAPTISGTPVTKAVQGSAYHFTPVGNDVDAGDSLTYSINKTPSWASFDPATGSLSGTPTNDDVGITTSNIVISTSDGEETVALPAFDVVVENINDAPLISGTPPTTVAEDTAYSFTPDSNDIDADTLTFSIENKPDWASFDTATGELSGTPTNDNVGSTQGIVISVSDGAGTVSLPDFALTVTNVNDAPTISGSPATKAVQDILYRFTPASEDVDTGDTLTYSITNKPSWASFDTETGTLTGTPGNDDVGITTSNIVISVSDGEESAALSGFDLAVTNVNDAPTISGTPATSVSQDADYRFIPTSEDIDGDTLSFTISNNPAWASFDTATGALTGTPGNDDVGITSDIRISVTDGAATATLAAFSLEVTNVNDAPTISGTPSTQAVEDAVYSFAPTASDIDGDQLTFSIINQPDWASFNTATGALSGTPTNEDVGETDDIVISVSDDAETASLTAFRVTVANTNDAPVIDGTPATTVAEDTAYHFVPTVSDVDAGDNLVFSISNKPSWASFDTSTGALTGTPTNDDVGTTSNIVISVSDDTDSTGLAAFSIEVTNVNDAPMISGTPATTVAEDSVYRFIPVGSDVDAGDNLVYSISNKPSWASFDTSTGALTGTPTNDDVGTTNNIVISVSDDMDSTSLAAFSIEVTNTNDAPVAVDDHGYTFTANDSGSYTLDVLANDTDVDNDTLQLTWVSTDTGSARIEDASVVLDTDVVGTVNLMYGIVDGNDGTATGLATVVITSDSVQAPTITPPENVEVQANGLFTKVDLGVAVAESSSGEPLPVSLVDESTFFEPGLHTVYWRTQDASGNEARASQQVIVHPLISISKDDATTEGTTHSVEVYLNGEAPTYPITIPYTVSGSSDVADHNLLSGNVVISSGTTGSIEFSVAADEVVEEAETIEITLDESLNLGSKSQHVLTIYEDNVAPEVSIEVTQSGESRLLVVNSVDVVTVAASVTDVNAGDTHGYHWINENAQLANISLNEQQFIFSPEDLTPGIYQLKLEVTDSALAKVATDIYLEVVSQLATLDGQDSDGDLIPDDQEGFADSDNDGIPDYQDAISQCNVLQEQALESQSYLVEGQPGVCLRKGVTLASNQTGGAQLMTSELVADTEAENIGGVFDFVAYGLPTAGQTYQVVFPQRLPIPANAVYRKYKETTGWVDFQTDASNYVSSTLGEEGYCPPPGDSAWRVGLTEGHWCVQLTIQDGGPNDDDGMANGSIVDPGGVSTTSKNTLPVAFNDNVYVTIDGSVYIDVLANDRDGDNDSLTITSASAKFGTVSIENGKLAYRPADKFYGTDIISYSVTDGKGGTAYAEVSVNVTQFAGSVINNSAGGGSMGGLPVLALGLLVALRRYGRKFSVALLALLSFSSQANWYLDADVGVSKADARLSVADSQLQSSDKQDTAWSLGLGYRFNPDWAVTGRYLDLGKGKATLIPGSGADPVEFHASVAKVTPALAEGIALDVGYTLIQGEKARMQAVLGSFFWEVDFDSEYQSSHITSSEDGIDPYVGIGVDYQFNNQWSASWRVNHYFIDLNDVTTLAVRLSYYFGSESN